MKQHIAVRLKSDLFQAEKSLPQKNDNVICPTTLGKRQVSSLPRVPPQKTAPAPSGFSQQLLGQRVVTVVFSATGRAANCTESGHCVLQELQLS